MKHILTDWRISNCGGVARGLAPWVGGGAADTGNVGLFTIPANGFGPEIQLVSKGTQYDWPSLGGKEFLNSTIFFAGSGKDNYHSMQYQSSWEDADGSMTLRGVDTILGPARAGKWWHLDYRPGRCDGSWGWKLPTQTCDKLGRRLGSMFTVIMPSKDYPTDKSVNAGSVGNVGDYRAVRSGTMTHFGLKGEAAAADQCTPPQTCGDTVTRSWDPDLTGPFNHAVYGGWYLTWDGGVPVHINIQKIQLPENSIMVQATTLPAGTKASDLTVYVYTYIRGICRGGGLLFRCIYSYECCML